VTLAGTTVFFLVDVAGEWIADGDTAADARVLGGAALAVVVVACGVLLARRLTAGGGVPARGVPVRWLAAGAVAAAVLGALMLAGDEYAGWAYAPVTVAAIAATFLPARPRWALLAGAAAAGSAVGGLVAWAAGDGLGEAVAYPAALTAVVAAATLGMLWSWDVADRLDGARGLAAELAVKDERLRFAADLHDIQGHHLQVIALKSELAARLAERDPARAAAEMEEVRQMATDAIRDTRAVVQGYRRTTLDEEIANATRVLAAADIDATMTVVDAAGDADLLGLVVREATTNVLRHSRAVHASVDYRVVGGSARLRIGNDGVTDPAGSPGPSGSPEPSGSPGPSGDGAGGTGLRSLAERLAAAGGSLTWARDGDRFEVAATLPVGGTDRVTS
jgi:two-component system sensor histidine kinase DesK